MFREAGADRAVTGIDDRIAKRDGRGIHVPLGDRPHACQKNIKIRATDIDTEGVSHANLAEWLKNGTVADRDRQLRAGYYRHRLLIERNALTVRVSNLQRIKADLDWRQYPQRPAASQYVLHRVVQRQCVNLCGQPIEGVTAETEFGGVDIVQVYRPIESRWRRDLRARRHAAKQDDARAC